jgi:hypothetical protein
MHSNFRCIVIALCISAKAGNTSSKHQAQKINTDFSPTAGSYKWFYFLQNFVQTIYHCTTSVPTTRKDLPLSNLISLFITLASIRVATDGALMLGK